MTLPALGDVGLPDRITGIKLLSGADTLTPTFSFDELPSDAVNFVSVYDLQKRNETTGFAESLQLFFLPNDTTEFSVPDGLLDEDGQYALAFQSTFRRTSGTNPSGSSQEGALLSQRVDYTFFNLSDVPITEEIYLPEVVIEDGRTVYRFSNRVIADLIEYYDPIVAVGYDYEIGEGNPNFSSFVLPSLGDDLYELHLFEESVADYIFESFVGAETIYNFVDGGVSKFRILGIETDLGLDPNDPTAFITGLSFFSDGVFTGTMTPTTVETEVVPLPASITLLFFGLMSLKLQARLRQA